MSDIVEMANALVAAAHAAKRALAHDGQEDVPPSAARTNDPPALPSQRLD